MTDIQVVEVQIPGLQGPQGEPSPDMDEILAAQAAAEAAAAAAAVSADEAEDWAATAAAAGQIYPDTTAGLAATADGGYFYVPSGDADESLILYRDVAGVATEIKRSPSAAAIDDILRVVPDAAPINYVGGICDEQGSYSMVIRPDGTSVFHTFEVSSLATMVSYGTPNSFNSDEMVGGYAWGIADGLGNVALALKDDGTLVLKAIDQLDSINGIAMDAYLGGGEGSAEVPVGSFTADINHIVGYGQSRSTGYDSLPVLSVAQDYDNLMFVGGVRPADGGAAPGIYVSLVPLVEHAGSVPHGETQMAGMTACIKERIGVENLIAYGDHSYQMLASEHGLDGTAIDNLDTGSTPFNNVKAAIDAGYARAQGLGKSYKWRGFTWSQGEQDYNVSTLAATYEAKLIALRSDLDTYAKSVTGQPEDATCFIDQLDDHAMFGHANDPYLALTQLKVCKENTNFVMVGPAYPIPSSSGAHHTSQGSKWLGAYHGLAYKRTIIDGVKFEPLRPLHVDRQGVVLSVRFNVPVGNLVIDNVTFTPRANAGLTLVDAANVNIGIVSATVTGRDMLRVIAVTAPAAGAKLRYAFTAGGNLRDSQGDTIVFAGAGLNKPMHNWCVIFEEILT